MCFTHNTMVKGVNDNGLGLKGRMVLLALFFIILRDGVYGKRNTASMEKDLEVERKLKLLNKPAVKSIRSKDGDIIDCVDIYKQPAFDHPLLKNHTIHMTPGRGLQRVTNKEKPSSTVEISQVWRKSGSCPKGTVPIRRAQKQVLLRTPSLEKYGRRISHFIYKPNTTKSDALDSTENPSEDHAVAVLLTQGYSYSGAQAVVNVWSTFVENDTEYSNVMIFLRNGPYYDFDAIEAGWGNNPSLYGDQRTRLTTYWTNDASKTTGCFDLLCPGFVQTSHDVALGSAIEPLSQHGGPQYAVTYSVTWDPDTDSWWLQLGDETVVGYWPSLIFSTMKNAATIVLWGGEVYSKKLGTPHTGTWMGSGSFSQDWFHGPCFMKEIRIRSNSLVWKYPEWVYTYQDQYNCYDAFNYVEGHSDPPFFFGGPGRNFKCP
ncbi:protein neprosin-like [Magnolia sinica]|uniref:protein neprosin-like n=1 Tax=Magnolia sinica TaxID=86752 RepID=UPI0026587615|nr:protein neprosin-like [Magnolia sinica]